MKKISLAIVEDEPIIRKSLSDYLGKSSSFDLFQVNVSVEEFLAAASNSQQEGPDVILLDIQLPGISGIAGIPAIKALFPEVDIIILTTFEEEEKIFAALSAGACSYLSKRTPLQRIKEAILTVHGGGSYMSPSVARKIADHFTPKRRTARNAVLTSRQQDIVNGILDGLSYKMVADRLNISIDTVRTHIKHIYRALNINSKGELIKKAIRKGWAT